MKEHLIVHDFLAMAAAGILDPAEQRRVENHLQSCAECRDEFSGWSQLAGALRELPTPQAPPGLVLKTQRLLAHAAALKGRQVSRLGLAILVMFSWMAAFISIGLVRLLDLPLAQWLDISSTAVWAAYIGVTWLATALAAGLLGKRWQQEERAI